MNAPLSKVITLPNTNEKSKKNTKEISKDSRVIPSSNIQNIYSLYTSEFANLDIANLKYYLESSRKGLNFWKSLLFEYIRRIDLRISAVCQTRKLSVLGRNYSVECSDSGMKAFVEKLISKIGSIQNFFTDIVESSIQGLSMFEINYKLCDEKIFIDNIRRIQNHLIVYNDLSEEYLILDALKTSAINLRLASGTVTDRIDVNTLPLLDIPEEKLLEVHSFDGDHPNGFLNGCIDSLILAYFFKSYSVKDWQVFIEKFASPTVVGKYTALNQHDKNSLMLAIQNLKNNASAIIPGEADIIFRGDENKGEGSAVFNSNIDFWNNEITIRVLGQNLTTSLNNHGSYAAAQVHNAVRHDIIQSDLTLIENTMNTLIKKIIDLNFADVSEYPKFSFNK
jgi:phage gp29-like protein